MLLQTENCGSYLLFFFFLFLWVTYGKCFPVLYILLMMDSRFLVDTSMCNPRLVIERGTGIRPLVTDQTVFSFHTGNLPWIYLLTKEHVLNIH